jgi:glycosyltransferase involved in cell wall biosynthesis
MKNKLGVVVARDQWNFFHDIYRELQNRFDTEIFRPRTVSQLSPQGRINQWLFWYDLRRFLERNDAVFFEWAEKLLVQATLLPKSCPIITRLHSYELYTYAPRVRWSQVDAIIFCSRAMQERFTALYPEYLGKTFVIYNGVDTSKFTPVSRTFAGRLGMLGGISPVKRIYDMILVCYELHQHGYPFSLYIGGDVPAWTEPRYLVAIKEMIVRLGLQESVFMEGLIHDPATWLQKIDIFVSNSYWEGQQVALLEAMASGCYCLSHGWGGAEEVLPAEQLFITASECVEEVKVFSQLLPEEKQALQNRMRDSAVKFFGIERTSEEITRVVREIVCSDKGG